MRGSYGNHYLQRSDRHYQGGTYTGDWQSLNPNTPAVSIQTTAPVTLLNCISIHRKTGFGQPMLAHNNHYGCYGVGLDPKIYGEQRGDFLRVWQAAKVTIEHNDITGFAFAAYPIELNRELGN